MRRPVAEPGPSSVRDQAVYFYARKNGIQGLSTDSEQTYTRPATPSTSKSEKIMQHTTDRTTDVELAVLRNPDSRNPKVISVEPGPDTEAVMAETITLNSISEGACERKTEKTEKIENPATLMEPSSARKGERPSIHEEKVKEMVQIEERGHVAPKNTRLASRERVVDQEQDPDYTSDSATERVEDEGWAAIFHKALNAFRDTTRVQEELEENARTIESLKRRNRKKQQEIDLLKNTIDVLKEHSNRWEEKYKDTRALLREANAKAAEYKNDCARLSNALPEMTKDDDFFNHQFSGIFVSLEGWVLRYFIHSKPDSTNLHLLSEELIRGLSDLLGEEWLSNLMENTLHSIEAVAIRIIQILLFDTRMLGIFGDSLPQIEQHFGSCTTEVVNAWRIQTTNMIVAGQDFRSKLEHRVSEVTEIIENYLAPLADGSQRGAPALTRIRRLKKIVGQAAQLALECNQEPDTFSFHRFSPGWNCESTYMTDAHRTVDDENLGADGACVKFMVSPAVLRAAKDREGEPVVIVKARIVRQKRVSPEIEEVCKNQGEIGSPTEAQQDLALARGRNISK